MISPCRRRRSEFDHDKSQQGGIRKFFRNAIFAVAANDAIRCLRRSTFPAKYVPGRAVNKRR